MGISPVSAIGAVTGAAALYGVDAINSKENIEITITRLKQQRDGYRNRIDDALQQREINQLELRIENLQHRLDKMNSEEESGDEECQTCKNRKYQDGSDDPGVSFKTASKITGSAEAAVRNHEYEHVYRNRAKADREGEEIVSQSVVIKHGICPECGKVYVEGGETTTVTRKKTDNSDNSDELQESVQPKSDSRFEAGISNPEEEKGKLLDIVA